MNMPSQSIVSIAVALIICWALFAVFCSYLHEAVVQIKAERGRFLRKYLFKQLKDLPNGINWASLLYLHGTINLLSREANKPTSDIQPHIFAKTLVEIIGNAHLVQMQLPMLQQSLLAAKENKASQPQQFVNTAQNYFSHATLYNFKAATQLLKPSSVVSMLKQAMDDAELQANAGSAEQWVTEAKIYKHLIGFIEKWYTDFMDRVSLWYKKKTRQRLFMLGCLLALFLNIDSVQLFSFCTTNPAAREVLINYYQQNADTLNQLAKHTANNAGINTDSAVNALAPYLHSQNVTNIDTVLHHLRLQKENIPAPTVLNNAAARAADDSIAAAKNGMPAKKNTPTNWDTSAQVHNPAADTLQLLSDNFLLQADSLRQTANLPVGFQYSIFKQPVHSFYCSFLKLLGILISGLAASFGGPFWFDLLRKLYTRK